MTGKVLLKNATILRPGDNPALIKGGEVYIDGITIVGVEGEGSPFRERVADEVLDLQGSIVMPGFINTHTHTPLTYLRGAAQDVGLADFFQCLAPYAHLISREYAYWSSLLAQVEMIRNGITAFVDSFEWVDEISRAVVDSGLRAVLVSEIGGIKAASSGARANAYTIGSMAYDFDEAYGQERLSQALAAIATVQSLDCSRLSNFLGPHALYSCSPDLLKAIATHAKRMNLPISVHLAEEENLETQIRKRHGSSVTLLEETGLLDLPCLGVHSIYLDDEEIRQLQGKAFAMAHCLGSNLKLGEKPAPLAEFLRLGIPVGLGTDSVMSNDNLDILEEARLTALVNKGSERDPSFLAGDLALQMATCMGAEAIGLGDRIGRLKPGYLADLAVVEIKEPHWIPAPDPFMALLYASSSRDVIHVMVDGNWVMKDRRILTVHEEEILAKAGEITES